MSGISRKYRKEQPHGYTRQASSISFRFIFIFYLFLRLVFSCRSGRMICASLY